MQSRVAAWGELVGVEVVGNSAWSRRWRLRWGRSWQSQKPGGVVLQNSP
jgi:hypothetical protein